jgi:hypothetical protein
LFILLGFGRHFVDKRLKINFSWRDTIFVS